MLTHVTNLFTHHTFGVGSLSISPARHPSVSHIAIATSIRTIPLRRVVGRLGGLLRILGVIRLSPGSAIRHRLILVGITTGRSGHSSILRVIHLFHIHIISIGPRSLAVRTANTRNGVSTLLKLLRRCNIVRLIHSNTMTIAHNPHTLDRGIINSRIAKH